MCVDLRYPFASRHTTPFKSPHAGPGARAGARDAGSQAGTPRSVTRSASRSLRAADTKGHCRSRWLRRGGMGSSHDIRESHRKDRALRETGRGEFLVNTNPSLGSEAERSKSRARERSTNRSRERSRVRAKGRRQRSREPSRGPLKISQGTRAKCGHRRRSIFAAILEHRSGIRERQSGRSIMRRTGELTQIHAGGGILPALTRRPPTPLRPPRCHPPCAGASYGSRSIR